MCKFMDTKFPSRLSGTMALGAPARKQTIPASLVSHTLPKHPTTRIQPEKRWAILEVSPEPGAGCLGHCLCLDWWKVCAYPNWDPTPGVQGLSDPLSLQCHGSGRGGCGGGGGGGHSCLPRLEDGDRGGAVVFGNVLISRASSPVGPQAMNCLPGPAAQEVKAVESGLL